MSLTNVLLARRSLDDKLRPLQDLPGLRRPPRGWIRAVRDALGMSARQLAQRMAVSQPRVSQLEKDEVLGRVTLESMERAAEALGCRLVYALVPRDSLEDTVNARAQHKARAIAAAAAHHMLLEDQALAAEPQEKQIAVLAARLQNEQWRKLWEE